MSDSLLFMMGEFEAEFPTDRQYATNHMWGLKGEDVFRFGFTAYAVRLLQDVYFLDWLTDAPATLTLGQEIGSIESKKAESSLYSPLAGQLTQFNELLMEDPSAINTDKYGEGWLLEIKADAAELEIAKLMTAQQYVEHLEDVWKKTQRTIKGQLND